VQATSVFGVMDSTGMWTKGDTVTLKQITDNSHNYSAKIMLQLHCGNMDINDLSVSDIHSMQMNMKQAAIHACEIGFDGVEYHFTHGFTLCKLLDASYNRRTDQYGGDFVNRTRILTEILPELRNNTHENFIISVRMGDYLPESRDGIEVAKTFEKAGIDLLHISFGMQPPTNPVPEGFICSSITYSGCKIKKAVNIPVIAVNEVRTEAQVWFLIENDYVDLVAIGRGMLADPEFANHIIHNEPVNTCSGCKRCFWFTDHTLCPAENNE
jgi:2,4-dienoyl-CoA reductase-like NADH-dependent reductase (Old Yellow Enzyme family)